MTHTPAPWFINETKLPFLGRDVACNIVTTEDLSVAICYVPTEQNGEAQQANTRLIAAAADLLGALQGHHQACLEHEETYAGSALCAATEAAIAKATGGAR